MPTTIHLEADKTAKWTIRTSKHSKQCAFVYNYTCRMDTRNITNIKEEITHKNNNNIITKNNNNIITNNTNNQQQEEQNEIALLLNNNNNNTIEEKKDTSNQMASSSNTHTPFLQRPWPYPTVSSKLHPFFHTIISNPKATALNFFPITLIFAFIGEIFSFLAYIFTWYGVVFLILGLIWYGAVFFARSMSFPGYLSTVQRQIENQASFQYKRLHEYHLNQINKFINDMIKNHAVNNWSMYYESKETLEGMLNIILKQEELYGNLCTSSNKYKSKLNTFLTECNLYINPDVINTKLLKSQLSNNTTTTNNNNNNINNDNNIYESLNNISNMLKELQSLDYLLVEQKKTHDTEENNERTESMENGKPILKSNLDDPDNYYDDEDNNDEDNSDESTQIFTSVKHHWTKKIYQAIKEFYLTRVEARKPLNAVFTIDYLRARLVYKYHGQTFTLRSTDKISIDSMLVPPPINYNNKNNNNANNSTNMDRTIFDGGNINVSSSNFDMDHINNTNDISNYLLSIRKGVLFCNPNGGMYEYSSHWVNYYREQGFAVFLFNYRGYGRSKGYPVPTKLKNDGVLAYQMLTNKLHPEAKIIIHGESMGGMIACHVAKVCNPKQSGAKECKAKQ